jgi:signal transduction histidine kinase
MTNLPQPASCPGHDHSSPLALLEAAYLIAEQTDLAGAVQALLGAGCGALHHDYLCFLAADLTAGLLRCEDCRTAPGRPCPNTATVSADSLLGQAILRDAAPAILRLAHWNATAEDPDADPLCIAPLVVDGVIQGAFVASCSLPHAEPFTAESTLLVTLTRFAQIAVQRGDLARMRTLFVAAVSHELRTPITSIVAFGEMLRDGDAGPLSPRQLTFLDRITTASDLLRRIVEDLLDLSRLGSGAEEPRQSPIPLPPFLEDLALLFAPRAAACQVEIQVHAAADLPVLNTDPMRLQQAISNFLDNALKFSPPGSIIRLEATHSDDECAICVIDQGTGIPPEAFPHIFEAFYTYGNRVNENAGKGAGLGLAIVARIADMLGATIRAESTHGEGSAFGIVFPRRAAATASHKQD